VPRGTSTSSERGTAAGLAEALRDLRAAPHDDTAPDDSRFERYFHGIAEAHHVLRRVFRIVDEEAKRAGIDPLEHKTLIQIFAAPKTPLRVAEVAARMDIEPALASRLIKRLKSKGLVVSLPSPEDGRITRVQATAEARNLLATIDRGVRHGIDRFQAQLTDDERLPALQIFAFYLGASPFPE
jgi:DNA-binding MarR family transcriptional regulator